MDPATLAAGALTVVAPYLAEFGSDLAKDAAKGSAKLVWDWIKAKLTSPGGQEAVAGLERSPASAAKRNLLTATLIDALEQDPGAVAELQKLLPAIPGGVGGQTSTQIGNGNINLQVGHGASATITR